MRPRPPARSGRTAPRLAAQLDDAVERFDPFEALRSVQPRGDDDAIVPIRGRVTNRYAATALARSRQDGELEAAFVGLAGLVGPLPPFYTEAVLREGKRRNFALRGFLDVFLNRVVSLFVRTHEKYRLPALVARHGDEGADAITAGLFSLIGLGLPTQRGRLLTRDAHLLPYAGLLAREVRSAAGLEIVLGDHFGLPVRVQPFKRRWLPIATDEQSRLDGDAPRYARLGVDAVAGARTPDVSSTFRIVVGPVGYDDFLSLAPGTPRMERLVELVRFYMDPGLDFDVQVVLRKEDVPQTQLGAAPPSLGWNAWLLQHEALRDADDAVHVPRFAATARAAQTPARL